MKTNQNEKAKQIIGSLVKKCSLYVRVPSSLQMDLSDNHGIYLSLPEIKALVAEVLK